jgi:hypothetical protein
VRVVLLGFARDPAFDAPNVVDLRGRTRFLEMLALVRTRCTALLAPDGGILNAVFFLDAVFPITVVSLWSDPRQGLLKHRAASPNPRLVHVPLVGAGDDVRTIAPDDVLAALDVALTPSAPAAGAEASVRWARPTSRRRARRPRGCRTPSPSRARPTSCSCRPTSRWRCARRCSA